MKSSVRIFAALILLYTVTAYAAVTVTVNGSNYSIPQTNEKGWGTSVTNWIQAISANTLQPSGGTFTLSADVDFGANYGLRSIYLRSRALNPAGAGVLRLGNTEAVGWRNAANSGNLLLSVDSSDRLTYNGNPLLGSSALTASRALATDGSGVLTASSVTATELGYVSGVTSAIQTQIDAIDSDATQTLTNKTIDADGTGNSITNIENADIKSGANIEHAKMAALTASRAMVTDGAGAASAASVTATELGYVSGVTSAIQTQINGKPNLSTLTTKGDIFAATGSATVDRLGAGANGSFLKANSATATGLEWGTVVNSLAVNPESTTYTALTSDDVILADTSGGAWELALYTAVGNTGKVLRVKKTTSDANRLTINPDGAETIDGIATYTLENQYDEVTLVSDGTNWQVIAVVLPGHKQASASLANYTITAGQWGDLTSLSLGPGRWRIDAQAVYYSNGATTTGYVEIGVSTTSGNSGTGMTLGDHYISTTKRTSADTRDTLTIPSLRVAPTTTTTYYLKGRADSSITNLQVAYRITAEKVY